MKGNKRTVTAAGLDDNGMFITSNKESNNTDDAERFAELCFLPDEEARKRIARNMQLRREQEAKKQEELEKQKRIDAMYKVLESQDFKDDDYNESLRYEMIKPHIQALNDLEDEKQIKVLRMVLASEFEDDRIYNNINKLLLETGFKPKNKTMSHLLFKLSEYDQKYCYSYFNILNLKQIYPKHKEVFDRFISDGFDIFSYIISDSEYYVYPIYPQEFREMCELYNALLEYDIKLLNVVERSYFSSKVCFEHEDATSVETFSPNRQNQYMYLAKGFIIPSIPDIDNIVYTYDGSKTILALNPEIRELSNLAKKIDEKARILFEMFSDNPYANHIANACQFGPLRGEANARENTLFGDLPEHIAVPFSLNTHGCFDVLMNRIANELYPNAKDWKEAAELHKKVRNQKYFEEVASELTNTVFGLSPAAPLWSALPPICNRDNVSIWISSTLLSNADRMPYVSSEFAFHIAKNVIGALKECAKTKNGREQLVITNSVYNALDACQNGYQR